MNLVQAGVKLVILPYWVRDFNIYVRSYLLCWFLVREIFPTMLPPLSSQAWKKCGVLGYVWP